MNKELYINFLRGFPVDIRTQISLIEGYLYAKKKETVKIADPDELFRMTRDIMWFEREVVRISNAFGFICVEVAQGRYVVDE